MSNPSQTSVSVYGTSGNAVGVAGCPAASCSSTGCSAAGWRLYGNPSSGLLHDILASTANASQDVSVVVRQCFEFGCLKRLVVADGLEMESSLRMLVAAVIKDYKKGSDGGGGRCGCLPTCPTMKTPGRAQTSSVASRRGVSVLPMLAR